MKILLSNDDSMDSPFLLPTFQNLESLGEVVTAIPAEEQSWQAKKISRFETLSIQEELVGETTMHSVTGSPGDAVNIGLNHLHDDVDIVIAGVNLGHNIGLGYCLSSGTLGACLEGNLCGKPAIALSQSLSWEAYSQWCDHRCFERQVLERIVAQQGEVITKAFKLLEEKNLLEKNLTFNINIPFELADDWSFVETHIGHSQYGSCFQKNEDGSFSHKVEDFQTDQHETADERVIESGHVSISIINIKTFGQQSNLLGLS